MIMFKMALIFVRHYIFYIGCPILNNALRFLENYDRCGKMFETKVIWFGGRHKKVPMI